MTSVATTTQTEATGHGGWTNYETWVVNHWLINDECYYEELCSIIENFDERDQPEEIKQYIHWIMNVDEPSSLTGDLLSASFDQVNWQEIAETNR